MSSLLSSKLSSVSKFMVFIRIIFLILGLTAQNEKKNQESEQPAYCLRVHFLIL